MKFECIVLKKKERSTKAKQNETHTQKSKYPKLIRVQLTKNNNNEKICFVGHLYIDISAIILICLNTTNK